MASLNERITRQKSLLDTALCPCRPEKVEVVPITCPILFKQYYIGHYKENTKRGHLWFYTSRRYKVAFGNSGEASTKLTGLIYRID